MNFNIDNYFQNIENKLRCNNFMGALERSFMQNVGKFMTAGDTKRGQMFSDMLSNTERMMTGQKKHGFEQNKMTDLEKLIKKGAKDGTGN